MAQESKNASWLIVDFDGVVGFSNQPALISAWCKEFAVTEAGMIRLLSVHRSALQIGWMNVDDYWAQVCIEMGLQDRDLAAAVWSRIYDSVLQLDDDVLSYLKSLRNTYKLCLLSNTSLLFSCERVERELELVFDERLYSYQIGSKKPNADAYFRTFEKINAVPARCIIIDDSEKNLVFPKCLGAVVIKYENIGRLREAIHYLSMESRLAEEWSTDSGGRTRRSSR